MLDIDEINRTILMLESRDTNYATCERLADLYIVRDHITGQMHKQPTPLDIAGDSDFLQAISEKDSVKVWSIMDDLMDTLRYAEPRAYARVMERIRDL